MDLPVHGYLTDSAGRTRTVPCQLDLTGPVLVLQLPGGVEVSISDAYGSGPLALRHYADPDQQPAEQWPVDYDDIDGVEVYRISTPDGPLVVAAKHVPVHDGWTAHRSC